MDYLFDQIISRNGLANDVALAGALGVFPPTICRMRKGQLPLGPTMLIAIHDRFEMPIAEIRELAGMPKYARPEAGARVQFKRAHSTS